MKRHAIIPILSLMLLSPYAHAGAVMDMVIRDVTGQETGRAKIQAQSNKIRVDDLGDENGDVSMIFLGDSMLYLDHTEQSYIVIDEAMLEDVSTTINDAMAEIEKQLAGLPPEQRAMVEQMMQGDLQGMMMPAESPEPAPRIESMGSGKWKSYDCEKFAVFNGDTKMQEVCAADLDGIDGADELMQAFRSMGEYIVKMARSMPMMANDDLNPGELMNQFDGFPVHTVEFMNGKPVEESSLESISEKDLPPDLFAVPKGYRRQDPFAEH